MNDVLRPTVRSVQRLACALALDAHEAEDVAQEAWLGALRKGVGAGELGGWLAGAARRIARSNRRDEARRRERERRASERAAEVGADASVARIEVVKRVVAAVEELEDSQRTAIVLRYFEDLPPREIAARLGISVNTARSRVRRGLETLRARLDRDALLSLAPLALGGATARTRTASRWSTAALAASGAAVLVGAATLVRSFAARDRGPDGSAVRRAVAARTAASEKRAELEAPAGSAAESARASVVPSLPRATSTAPSAAPAPAEETELVGRILRADGRALAGAELALSADLLYEAPLPEDRQPEAAGTTTDADGRFRFRFRPHPRFGYVVSLQGEVVHDWTVPRAVGGEELDLGDLVLAPEASLTGRLLDAAGRALLAPGWAIDATSEAADALDAEYASVPVDPATGAYRFEHLPLGSYTLQAHCELAGNVPGRTLTLAEAGAADVDLVYPGPDLARRIRLEARCSLQDGQTLDAEHVHLERAGEKPLHPRPLEHMAWTLVFDDVGPGAYTLALDDPRFEPWRADGVAPGSLVRAELRGTSALRLDVRDRVTGEPLERFAVGAHRLVPGRQSAPRTFHRGDAVLPDGLLAGIVPATYAFTFSAEGHGRETIEGIELAPGETHALHVVLGAGEWAEGLVRHADGSAAAGCPLTLSTAAARALERAHRPSVATCRAGPRGEFRLQLPAAGAYWLEAEVPADQAPVGVSFSVAEDESAEGLVLVVPLSPGVSR